MVMNYMETHNRKEISGFYKKFKPVFMGDFKLLGFVVLLICIGYIFL